jgi:hypothetical protein
LADRVAGADRSTDNGNPATKGNMETKSEAYERCHALVASYLRQSFGELAEQRDDCDGFVVSLGDRYAYVSVRQMGDDDASLSVYAFPGWGIAVTPEVAMRLLQMNNEYRFGNLCVDDDGDIIFECALPAEGLTKGGLALIVRLISSSASEIEDELRMRFS